MTASLVTDQAVDLARRALSAAAAHNVDLEEVTVTGEGPEVGIVLLPHRDLGGFALIVSVVQNRFWLSWGAVADLEYHDDVDLAAEAFIFDAAGWASNEAVMTALEAELKRPIQVTLRRTRLLRRWYLSCGVALSGKLTSATVRNVDPPSKHFRDTVVELGTTSLVGPERPSVCCPVPLAVWRRYADPAWPARA